MNGDRAGFLPRMPARSRGRCIPIHLRVACVCSFCASVWCYVRKKMWRTHSCIDSGVIATGKTTDPLWTCVFMRGRERFFFFGFFLAGLLTIQPLSNPALPLSTYNMAAYPLAGLQTGREESADAEERPIRGRVIENTQRESTDSESRATRGRCSVCARECVCVCRERESPDEQRFALRKRQTHSAWHLTKYFHCFSCRKQVSSIAGRSAKETLFRRPASLARSLQQQQQQKIYTPNNKSIHTISHTFATGLRRFQLLQKPPFTNLPWYDWNLICGLCCFEMDMLRKIPWFLKKKNEKGKKKLGIIISSEPGAFSRGTRALKVSVFLVSTFCTNPICAFVLRRLFFNTDPPPGKEEKAAFEDCLSVWKKKGKTM